MSLKWQKYNDPRSVNGAIKVVTFLFPWRNEFGIS